MSKNVAVFVDVANIFYAAKAAGVDIDYVTLLKAATAGRDFVRAYAYTGLDPDNENQRQFHSFLARSGYKVISKDIRKYGDGRIKANLDIELVVDMMKTARNLDIAVVVSGDGDFAPAIRAVQEMGVRCEVISFRGNTSSDLIEVADLFTDIAQIARVEKGSARSGRRVAAEGDLSMTEVPEKETEGAPRRRRGRAAEERVSAVAERAPAKRAPVDRPVADGAAAAASNLIVLPGERLSRVGEADVLDEEPESDVEALGTGSADADGPGEDGQRRRRRRGGRGRGRGRRPDEIGSVAPSEGVTVSSEDEEYEEQPPAQLPHHTFGSVWDSQIGVPSPSMPTTVDTISGLGEGDEDDYDEPEVPEYLLAERRQRGQQGPGRGRPAARGRSAYQAALDRERFGRSAPPQPTFGGGRGQDRGRDRGRGARPQGGPRPPRPPMSDRPPMSEPRGSSEPWSEVPPELEQMLRAELSRKLPPTSPQPASRTAATRSTAGTAPVVADQAVTSSDAGTITTAKPVRRRGTPTPVPAEAASNVTEPVAEPAAAPKPRTRSVAAKSPAKPRATKAAPTKPAATKPAATKPAPRRRAAAPPAEEG